ncbi:MAG: hypothetical protein SF339_15885 [Blastocatellia bacterium]|nr:hypothetical protein [Blastocatellia bacterium]
MTVRRWLQRLQSLRHRVRACYLHLLFRAKLCRRPLTVPTPAAQVLPDAGADLLLSEGDRAFRVLCTEAVATTPAYRDWIAPLAQLSANATPADVREALARMLREQAPGTDERLLFSIQDYTQSLPPALRQATEFVQFGHATKQPSIDLLNALLKTDAPQTHSEPPAALLIHGQSLPDSK